MRAYDGGRTGNGKRREATEILSETVASSCVGCVLGRGCFYTISDQFILMYTTFMYIVYITSPLSI